MAANPKDLDPKEQAIKTAWEAIDKEFGKGSVMQGRTIIKDIPRIPTGSLRLDIALGGGMPQGRIIEVYGPEASGKTTLTLEVIKNVQANAGRALFVDVEHALDSKYASDIGVDIDKLYISQPDSGEQALQIVEKFAQTNAIDLIVVDSVAGLIPKSEFEGDIGDKSMGAQASLMSQGLRKLAPLVGKSRTCLIFTNQLREKIGIMFGNPETTPGGRALKYWASVRIEIRRSSTVKDGDVAIGNIVRAKIQKNKVAPPFRQAEFKIIFGRGIQRADCILEMGIQCGKVEKSGSWYTYKGEKIGNGNAAAAGFLETRPEVESEIRKAILDEIYKREVVIAKPDQEETQRSKK